MLHAHGTARVTFEYNQVHDNWTHGWTSAVNFWNAVGKNEGPNVIRGNTVWNNQDDPPIWCIPQYCGGATSNKNACVWDQYTNTRRSRRRRATAARAERTPTARATSASPATAARPRAAASAPATPRVTASSSTSPRARAAPSSQPTTNCGWLQDPVCDGACTGSRQALRLLHGPGRRQLLQSGRRGQLPDREQRLLQQRGQLHRSVQVGRRSPCATTRATGTSGGRAAARSPRSRTARRSSTTSSCRARSAPAGSRPTKGSTAPTNAVHLPGRHLQRQVGAGALLEQRHLPDHADDEQRGLQHPLVALDPGHRAVRRRRTNGTVQEFVSATRPQYGYGGHDLQQDPLLVNPTANAPGLPAAAGLARRGLRRFRLISPPPTSTGATRVPVPIAGAYALGHVGHDHDPRPYDHARALGAAGGAQAAECRAPVARRRAARDATLPGRGRGSPT